MHYPCSVVFLNPPYSHPGAGRFQNEPAGGYEAVDKKAGKGINRGKEVFCTGILTVLVKVDIIFFCFIVELPDGCFHDFCRLGAVSPRIFQGINNLFLFKGCNCIIK